MLVVIGGTNNSGSQKRVDILDFATSVWSGVHDLPVISARGSATICGDELHTEDGGKIYQCFLDELKDDSKPDGSVWTSVAKAPHDWYTTLGSVNQSIEAVYS